MRGRKRKSGARFPSGKLKPTAEQLASRGPNPKVLAERRALLGRPDAGVKDLRRAENPLDCMAERGWIPADLARFGHAYAELHRRAGLRQARVTLIADERADDAGLAGVALSDLTPEELARVWDAAMARLSAEPANPDGDAEAAAELKALWRAMGFSACAELHSVCLAGSWPVWAMQKVCGRTDEQIAPKWLKRREVLLRGLEMVREHLAPRPVAGRDACEPPAGPVVEETVVYVDETGAPDPVLNAAGTVVEVVRRRRLAG